MRQKFPNFGPGSIFHVATLRSPRRDQTCQRLAAANGCGVMSCATRFCPASSASGSRPVHVGEANNGVVVHHVNGTAAAAKACPARLTVAPHARLLPSEAKKVSVFDTFWPKAQRATEAPPVPMPAQPTLPPQQEELPQPSAPRIEVAPAPPPQPAPVQRETPRPVSVLKSGVVDGMAYTLYSDGSIEAQLPQGTLRFGSINELRNHIEQTS